MLLPNQVKSMANKLENENYKFRRFLKNRADEETLDKQFLKLHNELFENYDCDSCKNCCKEYSPALKEHELKSVADFLKMSKDDFVNRYTENDCGEYIVKGIPCRFLNSDNSCGIEVCKPEWCKEYPHTNKPERLYSLLSIVESASVCPVVFEMLEQLKGIYNFNK